MAILTTDHLFEQADGLLILRPKRKPRQTEIRRAISAAYYGVFHFVLAQAADTYVGAKYRADPRYALAYRSISHTALRGLCQELAQSDVPRRLRPFVPANGFGRDMRLFSAAFGNLQDKRHAADYDPSVSFVRADAQAVIDAARLSVARFRSASILERQAFLALLLFSSRGKH